MSTHSSGVSTEDGDDCQKSHHSISGTKIMKKMGDTMKKTQSNVKSAAKQTHANIKSASANATAVIGKTMQLPLKTSSVVTFQKSSTAEREKLRIADQQDISATERDYVSAREPVATAIPSERSVATHYSSVRSTSTAGDDDAIKEEKPPQEDLKPTTKNDPFPAINTESFASIEELQPDKLVHNPSVIAVLLAIVLAAYKGIRSHSDIWDNTVPVHVALTWAALALAVGVEIGRRVAARDIREFLSLQSALFEKERSVRAPVVADRQMHQQHDQDQQSRHGHFKGIRQMMNQVQFPHVRTPTWTTLGNDPKRKRQRWERSGNILVSTSLTRVLSDKTPAARRKSLAALGVTEQDLQAARVEDESLFMDTGTIDDPTRLRAKSLEDEAIEPLCRLRGMDIFLTDSPESSIANHSFLIEHGLRDRPTFIINILTQWGNVLIYFELPDWIKSWDEFVENDDDPEDVIALKRFLNGDDEYRRKRFKCLPVLVDGPGPIRYIAPPKNTVTIITENLPSCWKEHPGTVDSNGETVLHPCLEVECDLMANRAMRSVAALVKRYLVNMVGDVAVLIEKPYLQEEDEPRACVGMCRFDRVDVRHCPEMPPRAEEPETLEERDLMRASAVIGRPVGTGVIS